MLVLSAMTMLLSSAWAEEPEHNPEHHPEHKPDPHFPSKTVGIGIGNDGLSVALYGTFPQWHHLAGEVGASSFFVISSVYGRIGYSGGLTPHAPHSDILLSPMIGYRWLHAGFGGDYNFGTNHLVTLTAAVAPIYWVAPHLGFTTRLEAGPGVGFDETGAFAVGFGADLNVGLAF